MLSGVAFAAEIGVERTLYYTASGDKAVQIEEAVQALCRMRGISDIEVKPLFQSDLNDMAIADLPVEDALCLMLYEGGRPVSLAFAADDSSVDMVSALRLLLSGDEAAEDAELSEQNKQRELEIERLNALLNGMTLTNDDTENFLDDRDAEIAQLTEMLAKRDKRVNWLEYRESQLNKRVAELEVASDVAALNAQIAALQTSLTQKEAENTALETEKTDLEALNAALEALKKKLTPDLNDTYDELDETRALLTDAEIAISTLEAANTSLQQSIEAQGTQITTLTSDKTALEAMRKKMQGDLHDTNDEIDALILEKATLEKDISGLQAAKKKLTSDISDANDEMDELRTPIHALHAELAALKAQQ